MASSLQHYPEKQILAICALTEGKSESYLTVDELQITWALRITVSNAILGTSFISGVSGHSTIGIHGHEVKRAIKTARKIGDIHVEGELVVQKVELRIRGISVHEIQTRTDIGGISSNSDECKLQRVSARSSAVCSCIIGSLKSAVGGASCVIWAESCIPGVSGVAVRSRAACSIVYPAPIGIDNNFSLLGSAATRSSALLPRQ